MKKSFITIIVIILAIGALGYWFWPKGSDGAVALYFLKDSSIAKIYRNVGKENVNPERAIKELVRGPKVDKLLGYFTEIPDGAKVLNVNIEDGTAYVNFSKQLGAYGGGASRVRALVAQIVYTLTEFPEIKKVRILVNGSKNVVLGSEGYEISAPLSREDVKF